MTQRFPDVSVAFDDHTASVTDGQPFVDGKPVGAPDSDRYSILLIVRSWKVRDYLVRKFGRNTPFFVMAPPGPLTGRRFELVFNTVDAERIADRATHTQITRWMRESAQTRLVPLGVWVDLFRTPVPEPA